MHDLRPILNGSMLRTLTLALAFSPALLFAQPGASPNDALAHLEKARKAYAAEDYTTALAHADSAITLDSSVPGGYKFRGDIKQRQENLHGAIIDYTKAEKQDPNDARLYVSRGAVYITEGRLKEGIKDCDKAIKLAPNDPDPFYNRACAHYLGRNNEAALRDLNRSLELRKDNADALFLRGVVKGELFREEDGLADLEASLRINPEQDGGLMSLGVLLFDLERYDEAIAKFTEVIDKGKDDLAEAYYYRADCYYKLDNKGDACVNWRRSAELGDKDAVFIVRNYCNTDADKIPKKPQRKRNMVIEF